jgi:hypothetical protein
MTKECIITADEYLANFLKKEGWIAFPEEAGYEPIKKGVEHLCDFADDYLASPEQYDYVMGRRPHYQYERGLNFHIYEDINQCFYSLEKAWGAYGTQIVAREKSYSSYKRRSKYKEVIEQLHKILFKN